MALFNGEPHAFHFGAFARQVMVRLATNWMGDDGFLREYKWRHLKRTAIGDTLIGKGKVINKYIKNGEHLVDLEIYLENLRGNITEAALATISLFSKEVFKPR
jgi:acyl dehydratase